MSFLATLLSSASRIDGTDITASLARKCVGTSKRIFCCACFVGRKTEEVAMTTTQQITDETAMYIVISDMDGISDLFFDHRRAAEYAEVAEGSVFRLVRDDKGAVK
jgi:hypothetical protein